MTNLDLTPDPADIVQAEGPETDPPVRTCVEGHVRTQELPRQSSGMRGVTVSVGAAVRLVSADPTRAVARLTPYDGDILMAGSKQEVEGGAPAPYAMGTTVVLTAADEVWAMATIMEGATVVSVAQERWANG